MPKYTTDLEFSAAIEALENYLGDTATYQGYGATLADALSIYAKPFYLDIEDPATVISGYNEGAEYFDEANDLLYTYSAGVWGSVAVPTAQPGTPVEGDKWFDETINTLYIYSGGSWNAGVVIPVTRLAAGNPIVIAENQLNIVSISNNILPAELITKSLFIVRVAKNHTATEGSTIKLIAVDDESIAVKTHEYTLKIYDPTISAYRATRQGDFQDGYIYWFFYNGTEIVINGMDASAIATQLAAIQTWKDNVGDHIQYVGDDVVIQSVGGIPSKNLYGYELKFRNTLKSSFVDNVNVNFTMDPNGMSVTGPVNFLGAVVSGSDATDDPHFITKRQFDATIKTKIRDEIDNLIQVGTVPPDENPDLPDEIEEGTIYYQLGE